MIIEEPKEAVDIKELFGNLFKGLFMPSLPLSQGEKEFYIEKEK